MNRYKWIPNYLTYINHKHHDWIFLEETDYEFFNIDKRMPVYLLLCQKCGIHGIVRWFYLIITNEKDESFSCEEFMIKSIIE